ncbi:ankyrin repeat domain-containing protein [Buttiauxella izardii]|uniref:ankyrin repeat domain-containing protein n=1 Tax=Buttiauxella izardii TaxID=82991 RepID=UPI00142E2496|nr:ankyrin repeat domain-containing protein [Buttiauxella izardii]
MPKWIVIPLLLVAITISVLVVNVGKRYSNYFLSPWASSAKSINGLKRTWYFCERCLSTGKCEDDDIKQCKTVTLPDRNNALDVAVGTANIEAIFFLVNVAKTDVNISTGDSHRTPLMSAAYYGTKKHQEIAEFLLLHGANINAVREESPINTALLVAIWKNNLEFAKLLIQKGADPSLISTGKKEHAACKVALGYNRREIAPIIPGCCSLIAQNPELMIGAKNICLYPK